MKNFRKWLNKSFIAGIVIVIPIALTIWVLNFITNSLDKLLPPFLNPNHYLTVHIPGLGVVIAILIILLVGFLARNYMGQRLVSIGHNLMSSIPLVRKIYQTFYQILKVVMIQQSESFRRVVLIEYPRKGLWSLAMVTGPANEEFNAKLGQEMLNVFVPTTPNPTSGFYLVVPKADTIEVGMDVEDAFRTVISAGMVKPGEHSAKLEQLD